MPFGVEAPSWPREKATWPHAEASRFIDAGGHRWHVQRWGSGTRYLLLHGTAASTHSFKGLADALGPDAEILMPDLPGHGFTRSPAMTQVTPCTVACDLAALLEAESFVPDVIVGHSAGAAIATELIASEKVRPELIVAINGAFKAFGGLAKYIAPALAKMMYINPFVALTIARTARQRSRVKMLVEQTGSRLTNEQIELYSRLLRYSGHISGALAMMSQWTLDDVEDHLSALDIPVLLIVGGADKAVRPEESRRLVRRLRRGSLREFPEAGHLVHEEDPVAIAHAIAAALESMPTDESTVQ